MGQTTASTTKTTTFTGWLARERTKKRLDPVGDFAIDAHNDLDWTEPQSLEELKTRAGYHGAQGAEMAWNEWMDWRKRQSPVYAKKANA